MKVEGRLSKIDHIGILVKDLDKAVKLFSDLFDMKFQSPYATPEADTWETIEASGINLIAPLAPEKSKNPGTLAKQLERRGEGVIMLAFKVPNVEEAVAEAQAKGVRCISKFEHEGTKIALFHPKDTFGITVEVCEYDEKHPLTCAAK
ncbi:MAG: VOC family protein [Chloroflexi bacterium]|nr:VOC family protein [Chloroflexota bacterium]